MNETDLMGTGIAKSSLQTVLLCLVLEMMQNKWVYCSSPEMAKTVRLKGSWGERSHHQENFVPVVLR